MDVLKAQLERIQQQLGGLTASQKMLTASLVAIMVMTLLWWGRYAGQSEMSPLLDQTFSDAEVTRITAWLQGRGINATVSGDRRILVPTDRKTEALAGLSYNELLPENIEDAFDTMVTQMNPFDSSEKTSMMFQHAREKQLSDIIAAFPGVKWATVKISPQRERRIGESVGSSATVAIETMPGKTLDNKLVSGAASLVAGAQADIKKSRIAIVVNGIARPVQDDDVLGAGSDFFEQQQNVERWYRQKLQETLAFIPGVIITTQVEVDRETVRRDATKYDPAGVVQKPIEEEIRTNESTRTDAIAAEPGVVPNSPLSIDTTATGGASDSDTEEYTRTQFENRFSTTVEQTIRPAGEPDLAAVSIAVPRSFIVQAYKMRNPASQEPDDTALAGVLSDQQDLIRRLVQGSTALTEEKIFVETYPDLPVEEPVAVEPSTTTTVASAFGSYGKEIAIGVLALVSLFMVSAMVKRGSGPAVVVHSSEPRMPPQLDGSEELAGVAGDGESMLDGMELDEDAIKAQQMLSQVQTMVKDNPEVAANLIKRWMNRS